jgi:hypothetical protein
MLTAGLSCFLFVVGLGAVYGGGIELQTTGTGSAGSTITDATIAGNSALNNDSTGSVTAINGGGIDAPAGFTGSLSLLTK